MPKTFAPAAVSPPPAPYSHGVDVPENARWLVMAGQVGRRLDGTIPEDFREECNQAWDNMFAILAEAGMGPEDLVKVTFLLTDRETAAINSEIWAERIGDARPAATLIYVAGLAQPNMRIEIEGLAAKA